MQLRRLKLYNWCQHKNLVVDFTSNLNELKGPNGSGKSNVVNGIVFALTGNFSRNSGLKVDNIYHFAKPEEKAGVTLELSHGPTELIIERNLRPNTQKLTISGHKHAITKANEISSKLQEILGVNECLLLDYVFVDQCKIFNFLDLSPSVRAKAFGELFSAAKAEAIWKALGELKIEIPIPSIDSDRVRVRIDATRKEINRLQTELAKYSDLPEQWSPTTDPMTDVAKQWTVKLGLQHSIARSESMLAAAKEQVKEWQLEATAASVDIAACEALMSTEAEVEKANMELLNWNSCAAVQKTREMLEVDAGVMLCELMNNKPPVKPEGYCAASELKKDIVSCPSCGTSVPQYLIKATAEERQSRAYDIALAEYTRWKTSKETAYEDTKIKLANLAPVPLPEVDIEKLKKIVADAEKSRIKHRDLQAILTNANRALSNAEGRLTAIVEQQTELVNDYNNIHVTKTMYEEAKEHLATTSTRLGTRDRLRYSLDTCAKALSDDESSLARFKIEERKSRKLVQLSSRLNLIREVFKELPQVASQACLDSMVEEINDVLEKFDAPFRILDVNDLRFMLKKHNGIVTPAERLSIGEKAVFALAFRIVINSKFAGSLGLLCLDEPTAGLDEDNINCLEIALDRLRELSSSRGLQVILITHETGLDNLFDRVIQLSPTC